MKILLSVENFYPRLGGGEVFVDELMTELQLRGHEVYVLYVGENKPDSNLKLLPQKKSFVFKNIPIFNRTVMRQYFANKRWQNLLNKKIREIGPELIFTQLEYLPATINAAKENNIPCIAFIQNYDHFCPSLFKFCTPKECKRDCFRCSPLSYKLQYPFTRKYIELHKNALKKADHIFSDSKYVAELLKEFYGLKSTVLNPILYLDKFIIKEKINPEYITFINPIETKGAKIVLDTAKLMPEYKFLVVGGKDQSYINQFKSLPNVKYISWVDDTKRVYKDTKILLTPSLWPEPFGRVIPEAQINGIPCITSCNGGIPESVGKGGIVIDQYFNIDKWVESIRKMENSSNYKKYASLAKEHAEKLSFINQWEKFNNTLEKYSINLRDIKRNG